MAYVALYRSYRPKQFKEVIGQKHVIKTLTNAVMENKTSHAYIFSGLRGIGKTTIARILAKAVNCNEQVDGEPCNNCQSCKSIIDDLTPDIIELDAASNNGVDEMRSLLEKVNFPPSMLRKKVYIIDEAHMLSTAAFNALLKTLEEPPKDVMFILATTEPHKIPSTILSRCQRFDFKQLTLKELKQEISYVCEKENINIDTDALSAIAEAAEGGMRDALSILDQANVFANEKITVDDVDSVTGRISNYKLIELINAFKEKDATKSIYIIDELVNMGKEVTRLVGNVIQFCRDILLYKNVTNNESQKYIYNIVEFQNLANSLTTNELFYYIDILVDVQNKIRFTNSQKIYLEVGVMKIINSVDDNIDLLGKINKLQETVSSSTLSNDFSPNIDLDNRFNSLDARIKKINNDFEKANIDDFKEKIEAKLDLLEEVSSKNAALPTDLSYRIDGIEDKIRILNNTNTQGINSGELEEINKKLVLLDEKIKNIETPLSEDELSSNDIENYQALKEEIEKIENKVKKLEENQSNIPNNQDSIDASLTRRIDEIETILLELSEESTLKNNNTELEKEVNELKENYFVLIKTIQNQKNTVIESTNNDNNNVSNNYSTQQLEQFVNELLANVNRLSMKIQESNNEIKLVSEKVAQLQENDVVTDDTINQIIAHVDEISNEIKNDIYDTKFTEIDKKILTIENNNENIKNELSKIKQVASFDKKLTENVKNNIKEEIKPTVFEKKEYVIPKEEPKVIVTNETKTLQTIKNVYDVRIIERILHEARGLDCREEKIRLVNSWEKLEDKVGYVLAPIAKILKDGKMVANGKKEILIVYPTATICNHLMETKNYVDAKQVLRITFGKDYDFLALPENTWQEKRSEYVGQFGVGITYPKLTPINNPELNVVMVNYEQVNTNQKKPLQQARAFFGSAIVEEEKK